MKASSQEEQKVTDDAERETPAGPNDLTPVVVCPPSSAAIEEAAGANNASTKSTRERIMHCLITTPSRFAEKYPRLFHVIFRILVPILLLIAVSFFCGFFVAKAESGPEMSSNDAIISAMFENRISMANITLEETEQFMESSSCLPPEFYFDNETFASTNATELIYFLKRCRKDLVDDSVQGSPLHEEQLTFDWILCGGEEMPGRLQVEPVVDAWMHDYFRLVDLYSDNMTFLEAHNVALAEATGREPCEVHLAAGALFWFTIMTTIGYGNFSPSTTAGRALVYTLGFLSILMFGVVMGWSGTIALAVFDDFAIRRRAHFLTRGIGAPLFWLAVLCLWLLILAIILVTYEASRDEGTELETLSDSFWFAYISITTVGLGDFYIRPDLFRAQDMFFYPFLFLLGMVGVANFLLKFSLWLSESIPQHGKSLEQILEERRNADHDDSDG